MKQIKRTLIFIFIFILLFVTALLTAGGWNYLKNFASTPAGTVTKIRSFSIRPGQHLAGIAEKLEEKGFITSRITFKILVLIQKKSALLQAGEYDLAVSMSPQEILNKLVNGKVRLHRLTIPEGLNLEEISLLINKSGLDTDGTFLSLCRDRGFVQKMGISSHTLEGYIFPETYFFADKSPGCLLIKTMVDRFNTVFTDAWKKRAAELGLSVHQVVTLASIIEKETGTAFERPIISSVFHNRLKRGMRLESDPTVIYGIPNFNGNITRKDLRTPTPYNTYTIKGLPPGPIASPGKESLKATLYPSKSNYIFFVSKKDTTHYFSTNLREHNRAVRKYQLKK